MERLDGDGCDYRGGVDHAEDCQVFQGHAGCSGSASLVVFASNLRWDMREGGIPLLRHAWTVEIGAFISLATAVVPPSASIT